MFLDRIKTDLNLHVKPMKYFPTQRMASKQPKAVKISDKEAKETVFKYLEAQNRPYSSTDISTNLKGKIPKTQLNKVIDLLVKSNSIVSKAYGKQSVFVIRQDTLVSASAAEINQLDIQISSLTSQIDLAKTSTKSKNSTLASLLSSPTNDQALHQLQNIKLLNEEMTTRLGLLRSGSKKVTKDDKTRIDKAHAAMKLEWKKRKSLFKNIWSTVLDNATQKPADLMEEIGIEDDESVGVDIQKFM